MMNPHITIGINVFNGMPWLPETIESVRRQTYSNFKAIVIDDGSTDGTQEFLSSIRDPRFTILRQENRGITATLNRILSAVKTPWLVRLDADDISIPHRLETVAQYIERYPESGMFYSRAVHYQNGHVLGELRTTEAAPARLQQLVRSGYLPSVCHSAVSFNVEKARSIGGYRFVFDVEDDYDMFWRMALAGEARFIPEALVGYRLNSGSVTMRDMEEHVIHVLYVQYLLLSELWGRIALPFEEVEPILESLVDRSNLRYRSCMKDALVSIGSGEYLRAATASFAGFVHAPKQFLTRCAYHFGLKELASVGEDPLKFKAVSHKLWPNAARRSRLTPAIVQ